MRFERLEEDGMKASAPDFAWFQSLLSDIFQKSLSGRKTFSNLTQLWRFYFEGLAFTMKKIIRIITDNNP
ncbi:hypothetical protein [Pyramidobacter piscolens]|uniref:hypothetical protein n=1 Tax=Pyramidobacter piscolens TaxID=638849 RepID=UPI0012EAAF11|nr:hypothetical protein [Pyramidobacter piscolens]